MLFPPNIRGTNALLLLSGSAAAPSESALLTAPCALSSLCPSLSSVAPLAASSAGIGKDIELDRGKETGCGRDDGKGVELGIDVGSTESSIGFGASAVSSTTGVKAAVGCSASAIGCPSGTGINEVLLEDIPEGGSLALALLDATLAIGKRSIFVKGYGKGAEGLDMDEGLDNVVGSFDSSGASGSGS